MSLPPEISGNLASACLALIATGVGYIARKAHVMGEQVGRVYRTLFGEEGNPGIIADHRAVKAQVEKHERRFTRIEAQLNIEERRDHD